MDTINIFNNVTDSNNKCSTLKVCLKVEDEVKHDFFPNLFCKVPTYFRRFLKLSILKKGQILSKTLHITVP